MLGYKGAVEVNLALPSNRYEYILLAHEITHLHVSDNTNVILLLN